MINRNGLSARIMAAMDEVIDKLIQEYKADSDTLVVMKDNKIIEISAEELEKQVAEARAKNKTTRS